MKSPLMWIFGTALVASAVGTLIGYYNATGPHYQIELQVMDINDPKKESLRYGPNTYVDWAEGIMIRDLQRSYHKGHDIGEIIYIHSCSYEGVYAEEVENSRGCLHRLFTDQLPEFMLYEYDHVKMHHAPSEPPPY